MRVLAYQSFRDFYQKLPVSIQKKVDKQIHLLANNPRYPSLHVKKIRGTPGIWEGRVDRQYRFSFEMTGDKICLRVVGNHDDVLKNP